MGGFLYVCVCIRICDECKFICMRIYKFVLNFDEKLFLPLRARRNWFWLVWIRSDGRGSVDQSLELFKQFNWIGESS